MDELVLRCALEQGIISNALVQEIEKEMIKRKEILEKHPYSIWMGKNKSWYTYLPDDKKGRVLKKRTTQDAIEQLVIKYWSSHTAAEEKKKVSETLTLKGIFPSWLKYKQLHTNSTSYIKRITADWKRFYENDSGLINTPLVNMTKLHFDEWAHSTIKRYQLTKKSYYNMSIILRQCLDFAVENGWLETNEFSKVEVNTKLFQRTKKKTGETQVYNEYEEAELIADMLRRFNKHPHNMAPLAVVFLFESGLRIAEVCSIKYSDIDGNYIQIQRQEVREFEMVDDYTMRFKGFKIVEYTKSDDGYRKVYLTEAAKKIIEITKVIGKKYGYHNEGNFIFHTEAGNVNHYSIQAMIKRGCEYIDIMVKTSHKIRKTVLSTLIDSGLSIDEIRRMAGHADERTTYQSYCFNRMSNKETEETIEKALKKDKVIKGNHYDNIISMSKPCIYAEN